MLDELNPEQKAKVEAATRRFREEAYPQLPPDQREVALSCPPLFIYRIKATGVRGLLETTSVTPTGQVKFKLACLLSLNPGWDSPTGHRVFGLDAKDIEPVEVRWEEVDEFLEMGL